MIKMALYKELCRSKCRSPLYWDDIGEKKILGPKYLQEVREQVLMIRKWMQTAQARQKNYADDKEEIQNSQWAIGYMLRYHP